MNLNEELKAQRRRDVEEEAKLRADLDVIREKAIGMATRGMPEGSDIKADTWNLIGAACDVAGQIIVDLHRRLNR